MDSEKALHSLLHAAASEGLLRSSHDLSSGGLAITLAESAIAAGIGFEVRTGGYRELFSESPSRCLITVSEENEQRLLDLASSLNVEAAVLGSVSGSDLDFGTFAVPLQGAAEAFESVLSSTLSTTMSGS
jgi:phosphoribosylformylglycinamidine synthase